MKKVLLAILVIALNSYSETIQARWDFYPVGLKHLYNGRILEAYYNFNFVLSKFPNFHLNHKTSFYNATCLRYFGLIEESLKYLDSSEILSKETGDSLPNPFIYLARSDSSKALSCFKNLDDYPYNYVFYKFFNHDQDLVKFICLINFESYYPENKKVYVAISQKYGIPSNRFLKFQNLMLTDSIVRSAFNEMVRINCVATDSTYFKIANLKDLIGLLIAKAIYYHAIEDYTRSTILLRKIIVWFPYLFKANAITLPNDIFDQIRSQEKRINLLKSIPNHKALEEMIDKKKVKFDEINKISFVDKSIDSMFQNLLTVISENNKHLKRKEY